MKTNKNYFFTNITAFEIITIIVFIAGVCIAYDVDNVYFRIISLCVALLSIIAFFHSFYRKKQYRVEPGKFKFEDSDKLVTHFNSDNKAHYYTIENFDEIQTDIDDGSVEFSSEDNRFTFVNKRKSSNAPPLNKDKFIVDYGATDESSFTITSTINAHSDNSPTEPIVKKDEEQPVNTDQPVIKNGSATDGPKIEENTQPTITKESIDISNYTNISVSNAFSALQTEKNELESARCSELPVSLIAELDKKLENSSDELAYLLNQFLIAISYVLEADTVAFVWVDAENKSLLFDLHRSTKKDSLTDNNKFSFKSDILSKIAITSKPQILAQIAPNAELDLIPYYKHSVGINSFIGIPIITQNKVVGILCADTSTKNAYNTGTVAFLGLFTKVVSAFYTSFAGHYSRENANKTLALLNRFVENTSERGATINNIYHSIIEFTVELYDCTSIGIVAYSEPNRLWKVCAYKSTNSINEEFYSTPISLDNSLIGYCITNNAEIGITNIPDGFHRINRYERPFNNGTFFAMPIKSLTDTYGALFIEAEENISFVSDIDVDILKAICNQAGESVEKIELVTLYNKYVPTETRTGIFTELAFRERLILEFQRAVDCKQQISVALVCLDKYNSINETDKKIHFFDHILQLITKQIKQFEIIGRVNDDIIGVILVDRVDEQAKLFFERIRQQIAKNSVIIDKKEHFITISAGIASVKFNNTFDAFTSNATLALRHAQKRTNCIHIFE